MTGDPTRLLHDPTTAALLRRDLGVASANGDGVAYDVTAGLSRFESALAADLAHGTGAGATASGSGGLAVGALLLAGGLAAALGWQLAGNEPDPATAPRGRVAQLATISDVTPEAAPSIPSLAVIPEMPTMPTMPIMPAPIEVADEASPPVAKFPRARRIRDPRDESTTSKPSDYLREARELNAARGFLGNDPARALELAQAGAASFRDGGFAQEWEGIAVLALFELQRVDEADTRADVLLQRYPNGTYAARIRQARQRPGPE